MNIEEAGCEFYEVHYHYFKHVIYFEERFEQKLTIVFFEIFVEFNALLRSAVCDYPRKHATDRICYSIDEESGRKSLQFDEANFEVIFVCHLLAIGIVRDPF